MTVPGFRCFQLRRLAAGLFLGLSLSGCIYSGTYEPDYFVNAVDKAELTKEPGEENYSFDMVAFYKAHRKSVISSDASTKMQINYVDTGDVSKPAVVFVHGTPGNWQDFWQYLVISELKDNAHMVSIDRPGWGDTICETPAGKSCFYPTLNQQSKYLDTFIKQLDEQNNHQGVILVGYSLGGPMIGQLAFDYPEYVKGLIFVAGPFNHKLSRPRWYNRVLQVLPWIVSKELRKSNKEMLLLSRQLKQMQPSWSVIEAPIWVIQGSKDDLVSRKNLDYSRMLFSGKDAQFIEIEDSGHLVVWEKKSVVVDSIRQALNKQQPEAQQHSGN